ELEWRGDRTTVALHQYHEGFLPAGVRSAASPNCRDAGTGGIRSVRRRGSKHHPKALKRNIVTEIRPNLPVRQKTPRNILPPDLAKGRTHEFMYTNRTRQRPRPRIVLAQRDR